MLQPFVAKVKLFFRSIFVFFSVLGQARFGHFENSDNYRAEKCDLRREQLECEIFL